MDEDYILLLNILYKSGLQVILLTSSQTIVTHTHTHIHVHYNSGHIFLCCVLYYVQLLSYVYHDNKRDDGLVYEYLQYNTFEYFRSRPAQRPIGCGNDGAVAIFIFQSGHEKYVKGFFFK